MEPTCGQGNFIAGLLSLTNPPKEIKGFELQSRSVEQALSIDRGSADTRIAINQQNIFTMHFGRDLQWQEQGSLFVIGNPPWITNSALGVLDSSNLPVKKNFKGMAGFEAITGSSNFDIAEYIWLKLIQELLQEQPTIALLCKTQVARNVLQFAAKAAFPIHHAKIKKINAAQWFGAAVDACLFSLDVGGATASYEAEVYEDLLSADPTTTIGVVQGRLITDMGQHKNVALFDGLSPITWHQGIKHDAARVVELTLATDGVWKNKLDEIVIVESPYLYPLLKSSDLNGKRYIKPQRAIIVPHQHPSHDTRALQHSAPQLWHYLTAHHSYFEQRKSTIYKKSFPFGYFGLGVYSFAPYKVAISGFYKSLHFRVIDAVDGRPVMFDDTCYFLACHSLQQACLIAALLNSTLCQDFLQSIIFWDAKRPITKKILQRIDLTVLFRVSDKRMLFQQAQKEYETVGTHDSTVWPADLETLLLAPVPETQQMMQASFG